MTYPKLLQIFKLNVFVFVGIIYTVERNSNVKFVIVRVWAHPTNNYYHVDKCLFGTTIREIVLF